MPTIFGKPNPHYRKRNKREIYGFKSGLTGRMIAATQKKALNKVVKKQILKMSETKNDNFSTTFSILNYLSAGWNTANLKPLTPYPGFVAILQGDGQGDRNGNQIRIKKQNVKLAIYPRPYTALTNIDPQPLEIIIWIFSIKNNDLLPSTLAQFFMDGDSSTSPTGNLSDLLKDTNKDIYVLHKKIRKKLGYANYSGTGIDAAAQSNTNNDFKLNHVFTIDTTKYLPKTVTYNDSGTIPFTRGVFFAIQAIRADGTAMGAADVMAEAYMEVNTYFNDI